VISDISKDIIASIFIVRQSQGIGLFDQKELDFAFCPLWLKKLRSFETSWTNCPI